MRKFIKNKVNTNLPWYLYCLLISFLFLSLTSKNSFLYAFNDWGDANSFFTVGKSMMNGIVPYRDLFEQKGPIFYVIYGIGYLFSHTTFHGVFILEVLFFSFFLFYCHKITTLYLDKKYSLLILPILTMMITTSKEFVHGGSSEEFCFPMLSFSLYYFLKYFQTKSITTKELFVNGCMAGFVFMIKYTILGFWIGFMFFICIQLLYQKKYLETFKSCFFFLLGMILPFLICSLYFLINHAFYDFINCYFLINIKFYGNNIPLLERIYWIFALFYYYILENSIFVRFISCFFLVVFLKKNCLAFKFSLLGLILFSVFGIYWGIALYLYYPLPLYVFFLLPLIELFFIIQKYGDKILNQKKIFFSFVGFNFLFFLFLTYENANYKEEILLKKSDYFQYRFAEIINQSENPTLINIGGLDCGVYTVADIFPITYFFHRQNFKYEKFPDNIDGLRDSIKNRTTEYIIYFQFKTKSSLENLNSDYPLLFQNYNLIFEEIKIFEEEKYQAYLFKRKEELKK